MNDSADIFASITKAMQDKREEMRLPKEPVPQVMAVSKTFEADAIRPVLKSGHRLFGENRVQESQAKWPVLKAEFPHIQLHLIGPLQTNKVPDALALFEVIESVDREKLAKTLAKEMEKGGEIVTKGLLVQVNTGNEPQKSGIDPVMLQNFLDLCVKELKLPIIGLMCIPPAEEDPALHFGLLGMLAKQQESYFDKKAAKELGFDAPVLSMGMSGDYDIAACFNASYVRLGTAIFGARG